MTSVIGQDVRPRLEGLLLPASVGVGRTVAKEAAKHVLGRLGTAHYAMHGANRVLRPSRCATAGVLRVPAMQPARRGVDPATGRDIGEVLSGRMLSP